MRDELSGVIPVDVNVKQTNNQHKLLFPAPKIHIQNQISPSNFSFQIQQSNTGLHSCQSRLFHGKSGTSTFIGQDCCLLHTYTRPNLRSCRPTPGPRSTPKSPCPTIPSNCRRSVRRLLGTLSLDCFRRFVPLQLVRSLQNFWEIFFKVFRLCVIALHHLPNLGA